MPRVVPAESLNEMLFCTGPEVGQAERHHLLPLPVLLEPAAVVTVDRKVIEDDAGNRGFVRVSFFENSIDIIYWPCSLYLASVAAFCGRHQSSLFRYQSMVSSMPASKLENFGSQPSSSRSLVESIA